MADAIQRLLSEHTTWPLAFCRLLSLFAVQGIVVLAMYGLVLGPGATQADLPLGLQLDPRHAVLHLLIGLAAGGVALLRPSGALRLVQVFAVLYLGLALFGTFTDIHFGMELYRAENTLHWLLGALAAVVAYLSPRSTGAPGSAHS